MGFSKTKVKFLRDIFIIFTVMIIIIVVVFAVAMFLYPGGNFVNDNDNVWGYSLIYNGLCDMREKTSINGQLNVISSILLRVGTIGICLAMFLFFGTLWVFFQDKKSTKILSMIASVFGMAFGPLNIGIIFIYSSYKIHVIFIILAPLVLNIAIILYTLVYFMDKQLLKINQYTFLALSITAIPFSILVGIASGIFGETEFEEIVHRLGNNIFSILMIIVFIIQSISIAKFLKPKQSS